MIDRELTPRERQLCTLVALGKTRPYIKEETGYSPSTVERTLRDLIKEADAQGAVHLLIQLTMDGQLPDVEGRRPAPDVAPATDVQRAVFGRLVQASLNYRQFRELREAYFTLVREGL